MRGFSTGGVAAGCSTLLVSALLTAPLAASPDLEGRFAESPHGMVAAASPLAAEAGLRMFEQGGNAVDAAAATSFTLAVVEPFGSGLGGDGIALVYLAAADEVVSFEFRARAPASDTYDLYELGPQSEWLYTGMGSGVPGLVAGIAEMHEEYGQLPLAQVLQPAIEAAEDGFTVGPALSRIIGNYRTRLLNAGEEIAALYLIDGQAPQVGDTLHNEPLGATLRLLAEKGPEEFYRGDLAAHMVDSLREQGSHVTLEDFDTYQIYRSEPLTIDYRGYTVYGAPLPFGGIGVHGILQLLNLLEFDTDAGPMDPQTLHYLAEASKLSSRDRYAVSGDPLFVDVPVDRIISPEYAAERVLDIDPDQAIPRTEIPLGPFHDQEGASTTHFTIADGQGNAVAVTQTLGGFFGSRVLAGDTGIVMNDQMKNFANNPSWPNRFEPGKRMHSSQSPTIVTGEDGFVLALGSPGAYRIITTVAQMVVNTVDFGLDVEEAMLLPRITAGSLFDPLYVEGHYPPELDAAMEEYGHPVTRRDAFDLFFGGVHAVSRDPETGMLEGAADPRRDGVARGLEEAPVTHREGWSLR